MTVDRRYFKFWAAEALLSDDLDALSDHERTIWLFAMCVASSEEPRWTAEISARLAKKCKTTPAKLDAALKHMEALGMVEIDGAVLFFLNAHRWNEGTEGRRKPSDEPERTAQRKREERDRKRDTTDVTTDVTPTSHALSRLHKEEEKEKEEEKDLSRDRAPRSRKNSLTPEFLAKVQGEEPELDIPAFAADYLNWTGAKGHDDKQQGFRNQLRIQWKRDQFTRRSTVAAPSEPYVYRPRMSPFVE